jgi:hypothetical protein
MDKNSNSKPIFKKKISASKSHAKQLDQTIRIVLDWFGLKDLRYLNRKDLSKFCSYLLKLRRLCDLADPRDLSASGDLDSDLIKNEISELIKSGKKF